MKYLTLVTVAEIIILRAFGITCISAKIYTLEETVDMMECYIANNKSPALTFRKYGGKLPIRQAPEKKLFCRIFANFRTNCNLYQK